MTPKTTKKKPARMTPNLRANDVAREFNKLAECFDFDLPLELLIGLVVLIERELKR